MNIKNESLEKNPFEASWWERSLRFLGTALADPEKRAGCLGRLRSLHRVGYSIFLLLLVTFLWICGWVGERNIFTTFFLFLPGQVWLLPLAFFALTSLLMLDWRLFLAVLASMAGVFLFYLDWQGPRSMAAERVDSDLTILTFNRGQRVGSLRPFKAEHQPDLMAMQEAGRRSASYLKADGYSDLKFGEDIGEFMLLSRFPILDKGLVEVPSGGRIREIAAWFVVDYRGLEIVIYNVHMPTPRDHLKAFRRGAFLRGLQPSSEKAKDYQVFWDQQIELAEGLLEHVWAEERPTILVGDLNTPERGYVYSLFSQKLQDAHEEAGMGFGWTFPGHTRNPLTLFGPWLRIDHQFADSNWTVRRSVAERGRQSQHLAVVADYELLGD